jgi:hypothetical protein
MLFSSDIFVIDLILKLSYLEQHQSQMKDGMRNELPNEPITSFSARPFSLILLAESLFELVWTRPADKLE